MEKLKKEEECHAATKNVLEHKKCEFDQLKEQLKQKEQSHAADLILSDKERNHLKELMDKLAEAQEENTRCRSELAENLEKYQNVQKSYETEQCTSEKSAELAKSLQQQLVDESKRVEELNKKLVGKQENLKQIQQSLDSAHQDNAIIKVNDRKFQGRRNLLNRFISSLAWFE